MSSRAPWWRFWAVYVLAGAELWAIWRGLAWFLPFIGFVLVPLLDFPETRLDGHYPDELMFRLPLILWLPSQLVIISLTNWRLAALSRSVSLLSTLGWTLSMGMILALGINVAHELNHKTPLSYRVLARCLLIMSGYGPYAIEHNRGHHKAVGLAEDPATARPGESFYRFFPRALCGVWGAFSKWPEVRRRLFLDTGAYLVLLQVFASGYAALRPIDAVATTQGRVSAYFFGLFVNVLASALSVIQVELVNYTEHYGLCRTSSEEPITAALSWNNHHWLSGCMLFKLEYHSDHHLHAARWYPKLHNRLEEWPQHPAGLPAMMLLALLPPLWRRVMDPLAERYRPLNRNASPTVPSPDL
ncbi:hypothetical protein F1559_004670 [Cyanidiococcus yangmingshanensis]|uniref:Fatty acid desaturase domain-containing protein n=1 Tax=Cyanidiococcus yangmingshanensis TaxID=2690220 RepID=A0A7J7IN58_9RHOD|nr:hypothetical protein F1559_004670 [Cyanidiococcus yangmingshanensis]